jgi:hypothetical protein
MTLLQSLFKAKKEPEPIIFKGRKTLPSVSLDDPRFIYRNKDNTNLAATFERARREVRG